MYKIVELKDFGVGKYTNDTPYIITEALTVAFPDARKDGEYFVTAECNGKKLTQKISGEISFPLDFLSCGELNLTVKRIKNKQVIEEWEVEPLRLQNTAMGLSSLPEIAELQEKITKLDTAVKEQISTLEAKCKSLEQALETQSYTFYDELKEKELELIAMEKRHTAEKKAVLKYLYRHYCKDFTDSDQDFSVGDYAKAIGLDISDLSESDLKEIKDFSEEDGVL